MPTAKGLLRVGERVLWNGINYYVSERLGNDELFSVRLQPEIGGAPVTVNTAGYYLKNGSMKVIPGRVPVLKKVNLRVGIHYYIIKWGEVERFGEGMTPLEAAKYAYGMAANNMLFKDCGTRACDALKVAKTKEWEKMPCGT